MALSVEQLAIFAAIAKGGSLGRAAAVLNMTQPALSRAVKRLEQHLGAELFERHSKGMQLTDIGKAFLPHATSLHAEATQALEEIQVLRGAGRGTVRVGAVASTASSILPPAIEHTLRKWPGLHFDVVEGVWDLLAAGLAKHEIDLALGAEAPDTDEIVAIRDCSWQDTSHIIVAADHPLKHRRKLTLADTLQERWTIPPAGTGPHQPPVYPSSFARSLRAVRLESISSAFMRSTIDVFQASFSPFPATALSRIAATSTVPGPGEAPPAPMGVAFAVPLVEDVGGAPPVAVLLVPPEGVAASACEPKIAPIIFPKIPM